MYLPTVTRPVTCYITAYNSKYSNIAHECGALAMYLMSVKGACIHCITLEYFLTCIQSDRDCLTLACYRGKRKVVRELIEKYGMNQHIVSEVILIVLHLVHLWNLFTHYQSVRIYLDLYMNAIAYLAIYAKYLAQQALFPTRPGNNCSLCK